MHISIFRAIARKLLHISVINKGSYALAERRAYILAISLMLLRIAFQLSCPESKIAFPGR